MFLRLLLLFTLVPMAELAFLIWIGGRIGVFPTLLIVAGTGVVGITAAKLQGFLVLNRIKQKFAHQELPTTNMLEGILILVGGAMLLTPGLLTDITGFLFILPFSRPMAARLVEKYVWGYLKEKGYTSSSSFTFEYNNYEDFNDRDNRGSSADPDNVYDISGAQNDSRTEKNNHNHQE